MILDQVTARNLELVEPAPGDDASATLRRAIDETATGMGARLLRAWILRPEISLAEIEQRLDAVAELKSRTWRARKFTKSSRAFSIWSGSRAASRWASRRREICWRCERRLRQIPRCAGADPGERGVKRTRSAERRTGCGALREQMDELPDVRDIIARGIADDPPALRESSRE